jgi:hypothetical protein
MGSRGERRARAVPAKASFVDLNTELESIMARRRRRAAPPAWHRRRGHRCAAAATPHDDARAQCGRLDIAKPWQTLVVSFLGTFFVYGTYRLLRRLHIDNKKIVPPALGGGISGALAARVVGAGAKTGGFIGPEGEYAAQHARISLGTQALGVVLTVALAAVIGLIVIVGLEKTFGLRVEE